MTTYRYPPKPAFVDDEDYPFTTWAADFAIVADPLCGGCLGDGSDAGVPCRCMIAEAVRRYPAALAQATADEDCPVCVGDGETDDGDVCACMLASFRAAHEQITWE